METATFASMDMQVLLLTFFTLAIVSIVFNYLILSWTKTLGAKNEVDSSQIRWSSTYKPAIGGISFFIVFLISFLTYLVLEQPSLDFKSNQKHLGILIAVTIGFFAGLADDAYNTVPFLKLLAQISCGVILIFTDVYIDLFDSFWLNAGLTIFWVVAVMNSINMLDNMDGITTTVSIFILLSALIISAPLNIGSSYYTYIIGGAIAALLGFLYFNWNPSKMFMGDTGSQFLGALLAAIGILFFWNGDMSSGDAAWWHKLILVCTSFVIPIGDSLTVTINRLSRGQSPMVGGRDHTTHHLSFAGLSDHQVGLLMLSLSVVATSLIAGTKFIDPRYINEYMLIAAIVSTAVISFLFSTTKWPKAKKVFEENHLKKTT